MEISRIRLSDKPAIASMPSNEGWRLTEENRRTDDSVDKVPVMVRPTLSPGKTYIAVVMKQERPYIIEWVAWHKLLGFEIVIADNGGADGQTDLLLRLAAAGVITYLDVRHFKRAPQMLAYHALFRKARRSGVKYLGFLDADEFFEPLSMPVEPGAGAALISKLFESTKAAALAFNWMIFGSSNLTVATAEPVLMRFTRAAASGFLPNLHFKSFCDVARINELYGNRLVLSAHGFVIQPEYYSHDGFPMDFRPDLEFGLTNQLSWKNVRIRHYVIKTLAEFNRKIARGGAQLKVSYGPAFFQLHDRNEIEAPLDTGTQMLLAAAMHDIETRLAAYGCVFDRPRFIEMVRTSWDARPTAALMLSRLHPLSLLRRAGLT